MQGGTLRGNTTTTAAMARLITISKIRIVNLPPPWSAGWETRYFKVVISCAGLGVGETRPGQLDTDGGIEWVEPLRLSMRGKHESLVAIVVSSRHPGGYPWCLVPGCQFEGFPVEVGHTIWRPPSVHPGASPNFRGDVETALEADNTQRGAQLMKTFVKGGTRQGVGGDMEAVLKGDKHQRVDEHLETRVEQEMHQGDDGHREDVLQGETGERTAEYLETLVVGIKSQGAAEHSGTFVGRDMSRSSAEQPKSFLEEEKSEGAAGPPSALRSDMHGDVHFFSASADVAGTREWRTTPGFRRDSESAAWTRSTVDGHGWLAGLEALTTSLAQGRGLVFAGSTPLSQCHLTSVRASSLLQKESDIPARSRDSRVFSFLSARSSFGVIDHSSPEFESQASYPGLNVQHVMPGQRDVDELVSTEVGGSLQCWSPEHDTLDDSFHSTGEPRFRVHYRSIPTHARTPSSTAFGLTRDTCGTTAPGGLERDLNTETEELAEDNEIGQQEAHTLRAGSYVQLEGRSDSKLSDSSCDAYTAFNAEDDTTRWQQAVDLSTAAHSPRGKRERPTVYTSWPTGSHPAATSAFTPCPSYEEATRIKWGEAQSPGSEFPLPADNGSTLRSRVQSSFHALSDVEVEDTSLYLSQSPSDASPDSPPPSYDSMFAQTSRHRHEGIPFARCRAQPDDKASEATGRLFWCEYQGGVESSSVGSANELLSTGKSVTLENHTTCVPADVPNSSKQVFFRTDRLMPRGKPSSVEISRQPGSAALDEAVARAPSLEVVDTTPCPQTRIVQPSETSANVEHVDPVFFTCVSPRSVYGGCEFQLRVSASLRPRQDDLSWGSTPEQRKESPIEAGVPGALMIAREKRVTVMLELPENVFKVLDPHSAGVNVATASDPPSARDVVWNGIEQDVIFNVVCLPGAALEVVNCGVCVVEGSSATRLSFRIEVEPAEHSPDTAEIGDRPAVDELGMTMQEDEVNNAKDDPSEPDISDTACETGPKSGEGTTCPRVPTRSFVACPPAPFLLANSVDPGPSVHESKEHGFRLTVQDGSLHSSIGPITIQEFAQVVECESDGQGYLVKTVVTCLPSGAKFPDKPLLMDFLIEDASSTIASETLEVLARKGKAGGWRKIKSEVRVDQWGTYLRAAVSHFCHFTWGTKTNPSDPARLESCDKKGVIEVQNATDEEIYFVLVPVSFDPEKAYRVTYTGSIALGVAGISVGATGSSGYVSAIKSHMLPAGFTPDDISVAAGGKFQFLPPPGASQGKLLVATITEDWEAGLSVRVVVLHGKFNTPEGKRRVILPVCLKSKSRVSARLGPNDIPVNMVMIMAGMGSTTTSTTDALSPRSSVTSVAPPSTVSSVAVPHRSAQSRRSSTPSCPIS